MTGVSEELAELLDSRLAAADEQLRRHYPGDSGSRQPVHTVYVPADRFSAATPRDWGRAALELLDRCAPTAPELADAAGVPLPLVADVYPRVRAKLSRSRSRTCASTSRTATGAAPTRRRTRRPPTSPGR
jgi:hypothetical protein